METEIKIHPSNETDRSVEATFYEGILSTFDGVDCVEYDEQQAIQLRDFLNQLNLGK